MVNVAPHNPVMIAEMLAEMAAKDGDVIVDGTFGAGGYTTALLNSAKCHVIGVDRDPSVAPHADRVKAQFGDRFSFKQGRFGALDSLLDGQKVDGIVLDIGVSSMQIDTPERGFSFRYDAPLDMRMSSEGVTAADIVNSADEKELARILWVYGEEKSSRRIAAAIVRIRAEMPITTTKQLRELVHEVLPPRHGKGIDPATRTFQALRIFVNGELDELKHALHAAEMLLKEGGRLVVVTFHSLEDRIVKQFLRNASNTGASPSRHIPTLPDAVESAATFTLLHHKAMGASDGEINVNPRSRSAKLRAAIRTPADRSLPLEGERMKRDSVESTLNRGGNYA